MKLISLNKIELDQRMKSLAQKERDLLHEVLLTIQEIDSRRTYLELGFGSLFDYLVQGVGYSEGSAQRRIDAARLMREIPQVAEKIQSGEIKLNQVSLIQKASREKLRAESVKVSTEQKRKLLHQLQNKNHSQTQKEVALFLDLPVQRETLQKVQADDSVRVELTLSKEAYEKIKQAQELLSHSVKTQDLGVFLEFLVDKVIRQKMGRNSDSAAAITSSNPTANAAAVVTASNSTATVAVKKVKSKPSLEDRRKLFKTQPHCQYKVPITGHQCQSRWRLQVDHKHSRWAGGSHDIQNLQILCARHNVHKYHQEAGIR